MKLVINESDPIHEICVNDTYAINDFLVVQILSMKHVINGPRREKTCLRGFRQSKFQTSLFSYTD